MLVAINQIRQFASLPPLLLWTESGPGFINKGLIANSGFCEGFRVRMAQASYSFIDVAALTEVRERFAAGDALVILSGDLEEVIWANGPGAALFGHAEVEAILGVEAPLGAAAKRQIAATSGFPDIGRDRALMVRIATGVSSQALPLLASAVTLPDGETSDPARAAGGGWDCRHAGCRGTCDRRLCRGRAFSGVRRCRRRCRGRLPRLRPARPHARCAGGNGARGDQPPAGHQAQADGPARPPARRAGAADRCQATARRDRRWVCRGGRGGK